LWETFKQDTNFFQLFIPSKKFKIFFSLQIFLKKKKIKDLEKNNFINNNIFFKDYFSIVRESVKFKNKIKLKNIVDFFEINRKYYFFYNLNKELFISSFSGYTLLQNLLWIKIFDNLLSKTNKYSFGIFLFENQPWEKALITSWKKYKHGKLIGYSHTTINYWHLNYFNSREYNLSNDFKKFSPDYIAVSSKISENFLKNQFIKSNKIIKVEALRYHWINDDYSNFKNKDQIILFLGDYKNSVNNELIDILGKIKNDLKNQGFKILFKPHPATSISNFDKSIEIVNDDLQYLVKKITIVVSSNTTSAIIEVLSHGLHCFLFKDRNNLDLSPVKGTILEKKVSFFYTKKDLLTKINNINIKNNIQPINYYYLDKGLKRWKKILKIEN
jgi:surface carbohydrate biosynthesis protein (TIGR04326 family)